VVPDALGGIPEILMEEDPPLRIKPN
jgi:hypothetical protein